MSIRFIGGESDFETPLFIGTHHSLREMIRCTSPGPPSHLPTAHPVLHDRVLQFNAGETFSLSVKGDLLSELVCLLDGIERDFEGGPLVLFSLKMGVSSFPSVPKPSHQYPVGKLKSPDHHPNPLLLQ